MYSSLKLTIAIKASFFQFLGKTIREKPLKALNTQTSAVTGCSWDNVRPLEKRTQIWEATSERSSVQHFLLRKNTL